MCNLFCSQNKLFWFMLAIYIYYFMMKEFDECPFTGKFKGEHTMCTHVRNCMCMRIQSDSLHVWFVMCRLSTVTWIFEKYTIYDMLLHVLIFQSNDDSVINQGRIIHTGTVHACTYSADYNEYVLCLFIFLWSKEKIMQYQSSLRCFQSFKWCLLKRSF